MTTISKNELSKQLCIQASEEADARFPSPLDLVSMLSEDESITEKRRAYYEERRQALFANYNIEADYHWTGNDDKTLS